MKTLEKKACGPSTLTRPLFASGMLLRHEDLDDLGNSARDLSRLLLRSLLGCGVICGLDVMAEPDKTKKMLDITVAAGVGVSCCGDPIQVPKAVTVTFEVDELKKLEKNDALWILLRGWSKKCAPRAVACDDDAEDVCCVPTREEDHYSIKIIVSNIDKVPGDICVIKENKDEEAKEESYACYESQCQSLFLAKISGIVIKDDLIEEHKLDLKGRRIIRPVTRMEVDSAIAASKKPGV